jgi:hypothetical protein
VKTHLPDFTVSTAGLTVAGLTAAGLTAAGLAAALLATVGAGLAGFLSGGLFLMALRAEAGAFARAGVDDFDFAAVFLDLATALAMTCKHPREERECAPYTTLEGSAQAVEPSGKLDVEHPEQAKTGQSDENQIDRDHQIEEARHDQNEDACNQGHNGLNMR